MVSFGSSTANEFVVSPGDTGRVTTRFYGGTPTDVGPSVLNQYAWYHVAYTTDGTTNKVYVNGTAYSAPSAGVLKPNTSYNMWMGLYYNGLYYYTCGNLKDYRVYNRALSQTEITNLWAYKANNSVG